MRKKDLLAECNIQGLAPQEFQQTFCRVCKNGDCTHAGWGRSKWTERISTQEERFFNPIFVNDPTTHGKFEHLREMDFEDMLAQAVRLELADQRGDWNVPEIPILDGGVESAGESTTLLVDQAVKNLARGQGKAPPQAEQAPDPDPEPPPPPPQAPDKAPKRPTQPHTARPRAGNTSLPSEGLMVGGGPVPVQSEPDRSDPWAIPQKKTVKVQPGAKIRMGGPAPEESDDWTTN